MIAAREIVDRIKQQVGCEWSEETGMEFLARWLAGFVHEVPIRFLPAGDPFAPRCAP